MHADDFSEYLRAAEPHKRERAGNWRVAIGLRIGYVEPTQPNSLRSPTQKYRLTKKGALVRAFLPPA